MGSISAGSLALMALTAAGAGYSAYESHEAGVAASDANKQKARVEKDKEAQNQINMRQNMLRALASQNAQAGVGGTGVNQAGARRQITQAQNDIMVSDANSAAQVSLLDQAGKNAIDQGNAGAVRDVIGSASKISGMGS